MLAQMFEMRPLAGGSGFVRPDRAMALGAAHCGSAVHSKGVDDLDGLPGSPNFDLALIAVGGHVEMPLVDCLPTAVIPCRTNVICRALFA